MVEDIFTAPLANLAGFPNLLIRVLEVQIYKYFVLFWNSRTNERKGKEKKTSTEIRNISWTR